MHRSFWVGWMAIVALAALPAQSRATAITDGGVEAGFGCTNGFQCGNGSEKFVYDAPTPFAPATGVVDLDTVGLLLNFSFTVETASFAAIGDVPYNGIDQIVFSNMTYTGTNLGLTDLGSGVYKIGGSVSVTGNYTQLLDDNVVVGSQGLLETANVVSGQCFTAGGPLVCHADLGPGGPFRLGIGLTPTPATDLRFQHTFNAIAAPEPTTALLAGAGLIALAIARRRQAR